jgi:diacylglycerol kinase
MKTQDKMRRFKYFGNHGTLDQEIMTDNKFSLSRRLKSFGPAFRGIRTAIKTQHNLRIHMLAVVAVVISGFVFRLKGLEWGLVALATALVLAAELINTAIEGLVDLASPEYSQKAGFIKDVAAGAVLLAALIAVIIAALVFLPKILSTLKLINR